MIAIVSLLVVLTVSILVTRVATIALTHTGLAQQAARFQARSALTGVGYTTQEAEKIVNHPVRRRILMLLMLLGNAGIVTVVSSFIVTFIKTTESEQWFWRLALLIAGLSLLWTAAQSQWLDRRLSRVVRLLLKRWSKLDVRDYAGLLHLGGDYQIAELRVEPDDWLAGRTLAQLQLREEGMLVLGIHQHDGTFRGAPVGATKVRAGDTLLVYGRTSALEELDERRAGVGGDIAHQQQIAGREQEVREEERSQREGDEPEEAETAAPEP